ncbi:MAG: hypothetical protein QNL01_11905 [Akkermansiaceae bacterium]|jgi:hypothetical protein|tara:strand:- start:1639 stop:1914 length:276 start_codon:yes stop_codon:yes gene_type:complete
MTEAEKQHDLEKLQDAIYMEKVLRARQLTPEQRLADVFELTNSVMERMLAGVMWQKKIEDPDVAKVELAKQIDRLRYVRDYERAKLTSVES